jgi:hypothetical protein
MLFRLSKCFNTLRVVGAGLIIGLAFNSPYLKAQGFEYITALTPTSAVKNTGEKPQSKVWNYDGKWWAVFPISSGTYVWRLDGTNWTSVLNISSSSNVKADCKVVNNVCHILLWRKEDYPSQLISLEYVPASFTYKLWTSRPTTALIDLDAGVETGTIDIDGTGRMWLASDGTDEINVRWSDPPYSVWSSPIILATGVEEDDICVIISMPVQGQVGVLWSNQNTQRFGFKTHHKLANPSVWSADEMPASQSALNIKDGMADDHLNVALANDGTLYCAVKTSYDTPGYPQLALLIRNPAGIWDNLYEVSESGTRPIVILNEAIGKLKIIYASSTNDGDILYRESSTTSISFDSPMLLIGGLYNNPTSAKNNYDSEIVILASDTTTIVGVRAKDFSITTGLETAQVNGFRVYPNPAHDKLFLELPDWAEHEATISFSKPEGGTCLNINAWVEQNRLQVDLTNLNLNPGLYLITIQSAVRSAVLKFIKV